MWIAALEISFKKRVDTLIFPPLVMLMLFSVWKLSCSFKPSPPACCWVRTSRRRCPCSLKELSGSAGVWSRSLSLWASVSPTDTSGWSEPPECICTSSAATTTSWRATCSELRSTRRTHLRLQRSDTSGMFDVWPPTISKCEMTLFHLQQLFSVCLATMLQLKCS